MNKEIQELINELLKAEGQVAILNKQIFLIRENCNHKIIPSHPKDLDCSVGICSECGYNTKQWYCPKNPPGHICEYSSNDEYCIHCNQPEERK